jgi:hypothetical protein
LATTPPAQWRSSKTSSEFATFSWAFGSGYAFGRFISSRFVGKTANPSGLTVPALRM